MVIEADPPLLSERRGKALLVTLNRPKVRNALNGTALEALERVLTDARQDQSLGVVVLRGAGGYFCAGGDLKERATLAIDGDGEGTLQGRNRREGALIRAIDELPQIVVSAVEGGAVGGGVGIVCVSDVVIAAVSAMFSTPEVLTGAVPAQIAPHVIRRLGWSHGRRLLLSGGKCDGAEAHRIGLVHEVVPAGASFDAALGKLIDQLSRCDALAVRAAKELLSKLKSEPPGYSETAAALYAAIRRQQP
ncbi:MAG TPA: enoyl-CoA hydratase/isomerase family protein [Pseudolabrys sp.]|nr:enoyl-CoA hydratase/isomerase family protein [Pseudolabrys sp.]